MDGNLLFDVGGHLTAGLPLLAAAIVWLVAARVLFSWSTSWHVSSELLDRENPALGVVLGAYLLGAAVALTGLFFGSRQQSPGSELVEALADGGLVIVLLRISMWVNDRCVLYRFRIAEEIGRDRNLGAAFAVAGSCLACGFILNGALTGFSQNFVYGLRDIAIYWLAGQIVLVAGALIYHGLARYDVHHLIEYDDNIAVGIGFGAFLAGLGIIVRGALVGAGQAPLSVELPRTLLSGGLGIVSLIGINAAAVMLITRRTNYEDEVELHGNLALSVVTAGVTLAMAMLLAAVIQR